MTDTAAPDTSTTEAGTFTRMDESTAEQWAVIGKETLENQPRVAEAMLDLLRRLEGITDGFATNQLVHALQTATMAEQAGADEEMVFASLMHDVGKVISVFNHPAIAAEMIRPYVRDDVYNTIKYHQDFQGRHYYHHFGKSRELRDQYRDEPWFGLCEQFTDDWDQQAFDPDRETYPLEHFEPLVRKLTALPRSM
jgi:predicted HD phosphohydrolase